MYFVISDVRKFCKHITIDKNKLDQLENTIVRHVVNNCKHKLR